MNPTSGKSSHYDAVTLHKIMLAISDVLALIAAFYLSYTLRNYFFSWRGGVYTPNIRHAFFIASLAPLLVFYFRHRYLYRPLAMRRTVEHLELLTSAWITFYGFFLAAIFFLRMHLFWEHRITMFILLVLGWTLISVGRFLLIPWLLHCFKLYQTRPSRVLCITSPQEAIRIRDVVVRESLSHQHVIGYVSDNDSPAATNAPPRLGDTNAIDTLLDHSDITDAFIRLQPPDWNRYSHILTSLKNKKIRLRIAIDQFGSLHERVPFLPESQHGYVFVNSSPLQRVETIVKNMVDRFLALIAIIVLSPLFLVLAITIKLESSGPVFFRQKRVGYRGRVFTILKFRTMRENTEEHHREAVRRLVAKDHTYLEQAGNQTGVYKITDTSKVTRTGGLLRKTSLDELPQLVNVLMGEMALVGPRPLPVYEVELFEPWQHIRHEVRPGITGFWQVFGRSSVSHVDTILMDIFYTINWSLALDLRIMIRTMFVLLTGKGAL